VNEVRTKFHQNRSTDSGRYTQRVTTNMTFLTEYEPDKLRRIFDKIWVRRKAEVIIEYRYQLYK